MMHWLVMGAIIMLAVIILLSPWLEKLNRKEVDAEAEEREKNGYPPHNPKH
jgi:formate hydrogenlyase subunit 4